MQYEPIRRLVKAAWPDQLPILVQANELIPEMCRLPYDYFFRDDPEAVAECTILVWEYFGFTYLRGNLEIYNYEAESIGQPIRFYRKSIPDVDRSDFFLKSLDDLSSIRFNGIESGRFPYFFAYCEAFEKYAHIPPQINLCAPWSLACNLYGYENLLDDAFSDPELVHEFLQTLQDRLYAPMMTAFREKLPSVDIVRYADAWASLPLLSVNALDEFVFPYYKKLEDFCRSIGIKTVLAGIWGLAKLSSDEERYALLKNLIDTCGVAVGCDPDAEQLSPEWFKAAAEHFSVPLSLGISSSFMEAGTVSEIVDRVRKYVSVGKSCRTPFSLTLNNIGPGMSAEKIHAVVQAARFYSRPDVSGEEPFAPEERESFAEFVKARMENNPDRLTFQWLSRSTLL